MLNQRLYKYCTRSVPGALFALCFACSGTLDTAGPGDESSGGSPGNVFPGGAGAPTTAGQGGEGPVTVPIDRVDPDTGKVCDTLTSRRVRRLSRREYANVVTDLLGVEAGTNVMESLPFEARVGGFDNQDASLFVSASLQENIADLAENLAKQADPAQLAPCDNAQGSPACLEAFIRDFSMKAYGRSLTDEEYGRAAKVAGLGEDYAESVRLVVELVLQSPHLLYLSELGSPDVTVAPGQAIALTPYEVASQLSFLLTGTRPDAALLMAAESGELATPSGIQREAERLLGTEAGHAELNRFVHGWLNMGPVAEAPKDDNAFPELTSEIQAAMQQELDTFISKRVDGGNGTLASLMNETSTDVPPALAPIYGDDLLPTGLDPERRRGVLSLAGVLTFHSADKHSGPIERGLLVREQLLCEHIPAAPQDALDRAAELDLDADQTKTTRQKYEEAHLDAESCRACHANFDPIGFGLEEMDALGRFRTTEYGLPVNSLGHIRASDVDAPFEGPAELSALLAESEQLESCMVERFFSYAFARQATSADACVVDIWAKQFQAGGGKFKDLVLSYVADPTFVNRREAQ